MGGDSIQLHSRAVWLREALYDFQIEKMILLTFSPNLEMDSF